MNKKLRDIASEEFGVKIKEVKREKPLTFEELFGVEAEKDKVVLTKEEYDNLYASYDKVYEQAKADILANMSDGGTSCHWCIDENRKIGKEEALKGLWHKVSENDLPTRQGQKVWLCTTSKDYFIANYWDNTKTNGQQFFELSNTGRITLPDVLAWAELPKYEEQ